MENLVAFVGFGEAAQAFVGHSSWHQTLSAFDTKILSKNTRSAKLAEYSRHGAIAADSAKNCIHNAHSIFSLVTADEAAIAAASIAPHIKPNQLFFDMNSVSPFTKRASSERFGDAATSYIDVAIMSPVYPKQLDVPLLTSGPRSDDAVRTLKDLGFTNVRSVGTDIGRASTIKMVRSIMVKGIEALTAECAMAAHAADVVDEVFTSLGEDWKERADYNLERMLVHGIRRSSEMEQVVETLNGLEVRPEMTTGTVSRQRELGLFEIADIPENLEQKLTLITEHKNGQTS